MGQSRSLAKQSFIIDPETAIVPVVVYAWDMNESTCAIEPPTRRHFLKCMIGIFGIGLPALTRMESKHWILNRCYIAGFQYHEGPQIRDQIKIGDSVAVLRESKNQYDCYAVALKWRGKHLGYVPRSENKHISRLLRQGAELTARITQVKPGPPEWQSMKIDIFMAQPGRV